MNTADNVNLKVPSSASPDVVTMKSVGVFALHAALRVSGQRSQVVRERAKRSQFAVETAADPSNLPPSLSVPQSEIASGLDSPPP